MVKGKEDALEKRDVQRETSKLHIEYGKQRDTFCPCSVSFLFKLQVAFALLLYNLLYTCHFCMHAFNTSQNRMHKLVDNAFNVLQKQSFFTSFWNLLLTYLFCMAFFFKRHYIYAFDSYSMK